MSEKNIEDLISLAKSKNTEDLRSSSVKDNNKVIKFIKELNIQVGLNKVPTYRIYYHYINNTDGIIVKKTEFFRTFNKYFKQLRTKSQRYYLLNDSISIEQRLLDLAKEYDKKYQITGGKREKYKDKKVKK